MSMNNSNDNSSNAGSSSSSSIPENFSIVKCRVCASKVVRATVITKVRVTKVCAAAVRVCLVLV